MSTPVNQGTNRTTFADGAGITRNDLDAIGISATQRAWDSPGYASLLAFDLANSTYARIFDNFDDAQGLKWGVFTIGGGAAAVKSSTPLQSMLGPGYLGVWDDTRITPPKADDATPRMSWAWVKGGDWFRDHAAASAGNTRYDLVHCAIVRSNLSAARDFEDAVTGAKSSASQVIAEQLAVDIQIAVGTQSTGTPNLPTLPAGRHALYAVRVSDTVLTEVHDFTIPIGTLKAVETNPGGHIFLENTGWANLNGWIAASGAGSCYISPPDGLRGNPNAKLIAIRFHHALATGDSISLVDYRLTGFSSIVVRFGLTATIDNNPHDILMQLQGFPATVAPWSPTYGNGGSNRNVSDSLHHFPAIKVTAAGAGGTVYGVTWYYIEG